MITVANRATPRHSTPDDPDNAVASGAVAPPGQTAKPQRTAPQPTGKVVRSILSLRRTSGDLPSTDKA